MTMTDADGMVRTDIEWTIEGSKGTQTGKLYELHEQELEFAKQSIRGRARPGDTVTIREI